MLLKEVIKKLYEQKINNLFVEAGADINPKRNTNKPHIDAQLREALTIFSNRFNIGILIKF